MVECPGHIDQSRKPMRKGCRPADLCICVATVRFWVAVAFGLASAWIVASALARPPTPNLAAKDTMQQGVRITQGATARYGKSTLGFVGLTGEGEIALHVWDQADKTWLTRLRLRPHAVFSAGGHFLRVSELMRPDGRREELHLTQLHDAGGLRPAQPGQPVLPQGGYLEVGLTRLELVMPLAAARAKVRMWPKLHSLEHTDPGQIREAELTVGETLTFGSKTIAVERIQAPAGEIAGFVVFSVRP